MRTLRQIPKVVGRTDDGETIYEARSARLILRGDAAHFNRLVRCSRCGREVPGRAVLGPADLDQPAQAVVCNDCVEAATESATRLDHPLAGGEIPAEPLPVDEPALADAQAEMNLGLEELVDELGAAVEEEAAEPDVLVGEPAEDEPEAVNLQLMDDVAGLHEEGLPALEEDEALLAHVALEDAEAPAPEDDEVLAGVDEDELPDLDEEAPTAGAGLVEEEPALPADAEPAGAGLIDEEPAPPPDEALVLAGAGPVEEEPAPPTDAEPAGAGLVEEEPAPAFAGPGLAEEPAPALAGAPAGDGLARRIEALEQRLAHADPLDPLRLVALEETVNRLAERADAQASIQLDIEARMEQVTAAVEAVQGRKDSDNKKDSDKLRRRLDQLGERLEQVQGTIDAEWVRAKAETAALGQNLTDLSERVDRLAEQAGDAGRTAVAGDERLAEVEAKVEDAMTDLAQALDSQRRELQDGLREGLADLLSAIPTAAPAGEEHEGRLRALERQVQQSVGEVSDLNELHAALDAGLGTLRAELAEVRTAVTRQADSKADLEDRLETFVRMSLVPDGETGRKGKKAAESKLGTLSATVQDLLREQRQLKDLVAGLEQASDAATAAAARASSQASSLGPVRGEMKLLHQEIVEQNEALEALRAAVDRLRQSIASRPAPAPSAPAAAKKAPAPAKAAPARAKAAPARAKAAPATKAAAPRAPRAKKAPEGPAHQGRRR